jgi:hypothetical protein
MSKPISATSLDALLVMVRTEPDGLANETILTAPEMSI